MIFHKSILGPTLRAGIFRQTARFQVPGSCRQFNALYQICQNSHDSSASVNKFKVETHPESLILGNLGMKLGLKTANFPLPYAMSFRSYLHSGKQAEAEVGRTSGSIGYYKGLLQENGNAATGQLPDFGPGLFPQNGNGVNGQRNGFGPEIFRENRSQLETNADIVHIKIMRNNAFVTVTDSKGNKKKGTTAGKLAVKGTKLARYNAETAAELMGCEVRKMRTSSVVVKVNGFIYFKKKKDAIQRFKEGYTNSRGDVNPIVYVEDTTRKPHNGCRRKKQRRY